MHHRRLGVKPHEKFQGIYRIQGEGRDRLATINLSPGNIVYGEEIARLNGEEYRVWDPFRSKLAAAILKGLSVMAIEPESRVLYLGAASGTTVSHVSDIVGRNGRVYAVEFAQRSFRDLVSNVCRDRTNVTPIFADARVPQKYRSLVSNVECIYSDIAQPDQARILVENAEAFLEPKGSFLIAIKARSVDVAQDPSTVFRQAAEFLKARMYNVIESVRLDPFELDHAMIRGEKGT